MMILTNWGGYDSVIMYRISTEFDYGTWREIFKKLHLAGIKRIVFIPTELAGIRDWTREHMFHLNNEIRGRKDTFCGWLYSENVFLNMWKGYYSLECSTKMDNSAVYYLSSR